MNEKLSKHPTSPTHTHTHTHTHISKFHLKKTAVCQWKSDRIAAQSLIAYYLVKG